MSKYEKHRYTDPELPIGFHYDRGVKGYSRLHWHEPFEILYYTDGCCKMMINGVHRTAEAGDLIFLNSNCVHNFYAADERCRYHCLTVDPAVTNEFGLENLCEQPLVRTRDPELIGMVMRLVKLNEEQPPFYKKEMKAIILQLIIRISRLAEKSTDEPFYPTPQCRMVMQAISYLQTHFTEPITVDEMSAQLGFSKYYFCRRFKEITGQTMVDYLNLLRCKNARRLLAEGTYNVSESARLSGFNNLSYFAKVYKKHMGQLPSKNFLKNQEKL